MVATNIASQSTVAGLGTAGYVSSSTFVVALTSTVAGLTTTTPVSLSLFYNTLNSLADAPYNYVSSTQLASTVAGLGSANYVSTTAEGILAAKAISTGNVTTSTVTFRDTVTSAEGKLYSQNGGLFFNGLSLAASLDISVNTVQASAYVSTATVNVQKKSAPRNLAVGAGDGTIQLSSTDGTSWSTSYSVFATTLSKLYYIRGRWYALGDDSAGTSLKYSTDGASWTATGPNYMYANTIAYSGSLYMVGTSLGNIYTSTDGITWSLRASAIMAQINTLLYTGSRWIAAGTTIAYSDDNGSSWTAATGSLPTSPVESLAKNSNVIVAGGNGSLSYSTDDGSSWTTATVTFSGPVHSIVWNTVYFIAGGSDASPVRYSRDGRTWTASSGITAEVTSIFWTGAKTYATTATTVYESTDYGRTWTTIATQPILGGQNTTISYSVEDRDDLITNNTTFYSADIPHYYNSTNQIYGAADKVVVNDTLNVRVGTIGVMKGDPSADYHLDVAGAVNASTVYVSSVQFNDVAGLGRVGVDIDGGMLRIGGVGVLQSTVAGLGSADYVSSSGLASTVEGLGSVGYVSSISLASTVAGLGSVGYVSSISLASTVAGLGSATYVSTSGLVSTVAGLGQSYVSTQSLTSTVAGLGQSYVSTQSLTSTVAGLGQSYVSTQSLTSTVAGLGQSYVSTQSLTSTVAGLGQVYLSSTDGFLITENLTSTTAGLGQIYLSASQITISASPGSAAAPSLNFGNRSTDISGGKTGFYYPTTNTIGFATNGSEAMRINSAGDVSITSSITVRGIGNIFGPTNGSTYIGSDPNAYIFIGGRRDVSNQSYIDFQVDASSSFITNARLIRALGTNANFNITNSGTGNLELGTNGENGKLVIDASGRVGIGTTVLGANYRLDVRSAGLSGAMYVDGVLDNARNRATDGSASGAGYGFINNENLGMYRAAADTLAFTTASTERMRIDSAGRVGIGRSNPGQVLDVSGNARFGPLTAPTIIGEDGNALMILGRERTIAGGCYIDFQTQASVSSGDARIIRPNGANNDFEIINYGTGSLLLKTNNIERLRIDSSGNVGINTTTPTGRLHIRGISANPHLVTENETDSTQKHRYYTDATGGLVITSDMISSIPANGVRLAKGDSSWTALSDERSKDISYNIVDGLNKIVSLRAVIGSYKGNNMQQPFLIAQDLLKVLPEAVTSDEYGRYGIKYTEVIPLIVSAFKDVNTIIEDQKTEITTLKNRLTEQDEKIKNLENQIQTILSNLAPA
jgi:hypothetical protein